MDLIPSVIPEEEKKRIEVLLALEGVKNYTFQYVSDECRMIVPDKSGKVKSCLLPSGKVYLYYRLEHGKVVLLVTPCEKHVKDYVAGGWGVL